jgi:hypothetical protein
MTKARVWPIAATVLVIAGCGVISNVAPVSGVITLDGKPLAKAHVAFQPQAAGGSSMAGSGSYGVTDASGTYTLRLADSDRAGALVGIHRVEINLVVEADDRDPRLRPPPKVLPAKYNRNTELQFKVERGGTTKANFELTSKD